MSDKQPAESTQQVTSLISPNYKTRRKPKRVAAGKAIAAKTKQAPETQNNALAEASAALRERWLKRTSPLTQAAIL